MQINEELRKQRERRLLQLVGEGYTLTDICRDKEIVELFSSVKHLRERLRKIMTKKGYRVYKDYFIPSKLELNDEMKGFKDINYVRFSEGELRKLKNLVKRHDEIENLLAGVETKTRKLADIPDEYMDNKPVNKTIRVNEAIYNKFISVIENDGYLQTLKKTEVFNILLYEMIEKLDK